MKIGLEVELLEYMINRVVNVTALVELSKWLHTLVTPMVHHQMEHPNLGWSILAMYGMTLAWVIVLPCHKFSI